VSGCWRAKPPGREWVPGYWREEGERWQWVPGFWTEAAATQDDNGKQVTYFPAPPAPPKTAPPGPPPNPDTFYVPGYYVWNGARYAWRPGIWVVAPRAHNGFPGIGSAIAAAGTSSKDTGDNSSGHLVIWSFWSLSALRDRNDQITK